MDHQTKSLKSPFDTYFELPPEISVADYLLRKCKNFSVLTHPCILNPVTGESIKYEDVEPLSGKIAYFLQENGLEPGDIVINSSHHGSYLHTFFIGVWRARGIVQCSYPEDIGDVLTSRITESGAKFLLCDENARDDCLKAVATTATASGRNSKVIVIVFGDKGKNATDCIAIHDILNGSFTGKTIREYPKNVKRDDVALLLPTSGTTGDSKAVIYTHELLLKNIILFEKFPFTDDPNSPSLVTGKQTHFTGSVCPLAFMASGRYLLMMCDVTQEHILQALQTYKVKSIFSFPKFLSGLATSPSAPQYDLSSLEYVFTAGTVVGSSFAKTIKTLPSVKSVVTIYGMTEVGFLASTVDWTSKNGDIEGCFGEGSTLSGMNLPPSSQLQIRDVETGQILEEGQKGELCFKTELACHGYWKNPKASAETFKNGWVQTGDVGYVDKDGKIHVLNRLKEVFKYFNNHINPSEIENLILEHPAVDEACCFGIQDIVGGGDHIPRAIVVLKPQAQYSATTAEEIQNFVDCQVPSYKKIRGGLYIVPQLPRTKTGKIQRNSLINLLLPQSSSG